MPTKCYCTRAVHRAYLEFKPYEDAEQDELPPRTLVACVRSRPLVTLDGFEHQGAGSSGSDAVRNPVRLFAGLDPDAWANQDHFAEPSASSG